MKVASGEKKTLAIAVLVSLIVCLAFHMAGQLRKIFNKESTPPVAAGVVVPAQLRQAGAMGPGAMANLRGRMQPATPELLALYDEQARLADIIVKASANLSFYQQTLAQLRVNEAMMQLYRRANNVRATPGTDAYMRLALWQKAADATAGDGNASPESLLSQYELTGAKIKVAELPARIADNEDFRTAANDYLAGKIDLNQLLSVEAELPAPGR